MNTRICILLPILALVAIQAMAQVGGAWRTKVVRMIDMGQPADEKKYHLMDMGVDTTLPEMFFFAMEEKKFNAYKDSNFTHAIIDVRDAFDNFKDIDTIIVVDPTDGNEKLQIVRRCDPLAHAKLRVLEEWVFNPATGKTDVQILGVAVIDERYSFNGSLKDMTTLFWLKYADIQPILARYNQYHPSNTLALRIWDGYFLSDVKPGKVK
jgi:hypothetical protein